MRSQQREAPPWESREGGEMGAGSGMGEDWGEAKRAQRMNGNVQLL